MSSTTGIHHITAIAGDPQRNHQFYTQVLGLRLVKKTVNFDDPSAYHLYYGNRSGDPGTILTFFCWEQLQSGSPDRGQAVAVAFSVPASSKEFWIKHLQKKDVQFESPFERFGKEVIGLQDPDGLYLELVLDPEIDKNSGWEGSTVPRQHTIRRLHGTTLAEKDYEGTEYLLQDLLGFDLINQLDDRYQYSAGQDNNSTIEIIDQFDPHGQSGKGTVHHIAFRAVDDEEQHNLQNDLQMKGYHTTEVKDRTYFKSVYFHEPGGVLFEIATDSPGFNVDEELDQLGTTLKLPEDLEPYRHKLEADLPGLTG